MTVYILVTEPLQPSPAPNVSLVLNGALLFSILSKNNGVKMGLSPILSVILPVIIDATLNNNGPCFFFNKNAFQQDAYRLLQCPSQGVSASGPDTPLRKTPTWADIPPEQTPPTGQTHPPQCMLGYTPPCPVHAGIHTPLPSACWDTPPRGQNSWQTLVKTLPFCNFVCGQWKRYV